ncbi:MAG: gliding motility-associated C-terminal domain-containing protein [Flavobacteriales bacterium]
MSTQTLRAQLSLTAIGTPATMNFNLGGSSNCSGAGNAWVNNVTIPNCYSNMGSYAYSTGCNNTGALHVSGTGGETALGGRASNSTSLIIWGVRVVNNTGQAISALRIKYRGEQWNSAQTNVTNTVAFSYSVSATPITNVTAGAYTNFPALNMSNLVSQGGCGGGGAAINGNQAGNFADITACLPVNIPAGSEIMLRWYETNDACNDHMLCIDDLEIIPLNNTLTIAPITGPGTVCAPDTGTYSVNAMAGVTYTWSALPAGASYIGGAPTGNQAQIDWASTTPGTYAVTVTPNGSFCGITLNPATINVTVQAPGPPVTISATDTTICNGQAITLSSSDSTGNTWNTVPPQTTQSITVNTPGVYIVTSVAACGTSSDTITISSLNSPVINLGNDTIVCTPNINVVLNAQNAGATYLWQDNSSNQTFTVSDSGTYYVAVSNVCGSGRDTLHIRQQLVPQVNLGNDTTVCVGTPFAMLLSAGFPDATYQWQDNSTNAVLPVTQPGTYYVEVSNDCGTAFDTLHVISITVPVVDLGNDTLICPGSPFTLNATSPGATYLWQDNSTSASYSDTIPGIYFVTVTNSCGSGSDTLVVSPFPAPVSDMKDTVLTCGITELLLDAKNPGADYFWSTNESSQTITVSETGQYWVEIQVCNTTIADSVSVEFTTTSNTQFNPPNTFSPNGDGMNDFYQVQGNFDNISNFTAMVYNRWGQMVYSSSDQNFQWNGEHGGHIVPGGVYYVVFRMRSECDEKDTEYNTTVTIFY